MYFIVFNVIATVCWMPYVRGVVTDEQPCERRRRSASVRHEHDGKGLRESRGGSEC